MKTFWLFRTNLRQYEYYHSIDNLEQFKKECHDFYLLMGIWMLENTELEEFVVWRLRPKCSTGEDIVYAVGGKKFIQKFTEFEYCFNYPKPDMTLFRGGFPEYGKLTRQNPSFFGLKLYLGAGQRVLPQYGGFYDKILVEDERDMHPDYDCIPFYKTANPNIFYPMNLEKKWDICWPCNFSQIKHKGQEWFIKQVAKSEYLKSLKILHVGNVPKQGRDLCRKYGVSNIVFKGYVARPELNKLLNQSKIGLVTSNELDGSPRVITEILSTKTQAALKEETRFISVERYRPFDVTDKISQKEQILPIGIKWMINNKFNITDSNKEWGLFGFEVVCQKNLELWNEF